ncbi:hypothetical protein FACS1894152_8670 [Bacilli bacterium]|nr:hypothetical protein FACS1894152_8670 [Bacilli bacterium]
MHGELERQVLNLDEEIQSKTDVGTGSIGNFKNDGKVYRGSKSPIEVLGQDSPSKELVEATPFGIYNIFRNQGFVNLGLSSDTATFAMESVRRWWQAEGLATYAIVN